MLLLCLGKSWWFELSEEEANLCLWGDVQDSLIITVSAESGSG